jgi:DNA-binding CsgD family transcriptional regulator
VPERESRTLEEALSEVLVLAELRPALEILAHTFDAVEAEYFRFPRQATGDLGRAFLELLRDHPAHDRLRRATKAIDVQEVFDARGEILILPLEEIPFGERGWAGLAIARGRGAPRFGRRDPAKLDKMKPALVAAHRRIRRFASLAGENTGLVALIEKRLGACAALARPPGDVLWMSESAKDALGTEGRAALESRLKDVTREIAKGSSQKAKEFVIGVAGRKRVFGAMSFVRESPEASVHYIAVELYGSEVEAGREAYKLTKSEREVYELLKLGKSNDDIARERFVSIETVRTHVKSLFRKFGVSSRVELLVRKPTLEEE